MYSPAFLSVFLLALAGSAAEVTLDRDDMAITQSVKVNPGTYRLDDAKDDGIVRLKGNDLTVDFTGVTLAGADETTPADEYKGIGIVAEGCKNLTLKGLTVRGLKLGMLFKRCDGLTITGCDVSRNWRQHLKSTPRGEDGADWLFGHENDKDEWLRYGAGIYIEDSKGVTVSKCRARNGQNGLCLSRVNDSFILDNDMSFLSGWGLAMWRSSHNDVSNNKFDWCMRGFSYKVYHRGQDSAGILVYEQCSDNVFAYNSATHGGDGFFLYAGNETLHRTGTGGCNRNLLYRNDFSHAAANGIESTFSDGNLFIENRLAECDHGVWGGYSYNTTIAGNTIRDCQNGISIEHGHANRIESNTFERCGLGVHAWGGENADFATTSYGQKQDTKSHGYTIVRNSFRATKVALAFEATSDATIVDNAIEANIALRSDSRSSDLKASPIEGKVEGARPAAATASIEKLQPKIPKTRGTQDAYLPSGAVRLHVAASLPERRDGVGLGGGVRARARGGVFGLRHPGRRQHRAREGQASGAAQGGSLGLRGAAVLVHGHRGGPVRQGDGLSPLRVVGREVLRLGIPGASKAAEGLGCGDSVRAARLDDARQDRLRVGGRPAERQGPAGPLRDAGDKRNGAAGGKVRGAHRERRRRAPLDRPEARHR